MSGSEYGPPSGSPVRVRLSRKRGWRMPPNTVKACRPGPWGNPFVVGRHGTAERCVELYEMLMAGLLCISVDHDCVLAQDRARKHAAKHLAKLRGKNLACWCRLDKPCHVDILLRIANAGVQARAGSPSLGTTVGGTIEKGEKV